MTQDSPSWKLLGGTFLVGWGVVLLSLGVFHPEAFRKWAAPFTSFVLGTLVVIGAAEGYYSAKEA